MIYKQILLGILFFTSLPLFADCPPPSATKDEITQKGWTVQQGTWPTSGNQFLSALASLQSGQTQEKVFVTCFYGSAAGSVSLSKFDENLLPRSGQWNCPSKYNMGSCSCISSSITSCPFN